MSINGNVVNVPADVNSTVSVLPRPISESQTIPIKLKRRLSYKHHYQFENVRPSKVLEAARYLVQTSSIFKNEGIQVLDNYVADPVINVEAWSEFVDKDSSLSNSNLNIQNKSCNDSVDNDTDDEWCEETERPSGVMDTLYYKNLTLYRMVTE